MRSAQLATACGREGVQRAQPLHVRAAAGRPTCPSRAGRAPRGGSGAAPDRSEIANDEADETADCPGPPDRAIRSLASGPSALDGEVQRDRPGRRARAVQRHVERRAAELVLAAARRQRRRRRRGGRRRGPRARRRARAASGAERKDAATVHRIDGRSDAGYGRLDLEISLFRNTLRGPWPVGRGRLSAARAMAEQSRSGARVAPARPRRDLRRRAHQPGDLRVALRRPRLAAAAGRCSAPSCCVIAFRGFVDVLAHQLIPRASLYGAGRELMEDDIVARRRVWYWRTQVPPAVLARARRRRLARRSSTALGGSARRRRATSIAAAADLLPQLRPAAPAVLLRELPDPVRAAALLRPQADEGLRAGRRRLGRQARRRPRPGRAQGEVTRSSRCGSRARSSARRAASPSAACSSSARRAPARRCSPRASRRRSTRRS